jgi:hypothetical protein
MGWRVLRFVTIVASGVVAMRVLTEILGRHCTGSLYPSLSPGTPVGFSLAAAALSYARHGRWPRTAAIALIVLLGSFVGCSITASNLFGAIDRGKQKYTMARMQEIARAIEAGRSAEHPADGWGTPFLIERSGTSYTIVSFGDCGEPDIPRGAKYSGGTTIRFSDDIVFSDGRFIRYPQGTQQ